MPPAVSALFLPVFVAEQATTLENPTYRGNGYRSLLSVLSSESDASWLRRLEVAR